MKTASCNIGLYLPAVLNHISDVYSLASHRDMIRVRSQSINCRVCCGQSLTRTSCSISISGFLASLMILLLLRTYLLIIRRVKLNRYFQITFLLILFFLLCVVVIFVLIIFLLFCTRSVRNFSFRKTASLQSKKTKN